MLTALLLATASPTEIGDALDAERAFAADAQTLGQWTAFRKWAANDATMFVPQPINAQSWLKDRKDPAKAIEWWPTASYVSCDGSLAVSTGGWKRPDGVVGYFSTVWQRQPDGGWKWIVDGGDELRVARDRPGVPKAKTASCIGKAGSPPLTKYMQGSSATGTSADGTVAYHWHVRLKGERTFTAMMWNGRTLVPVVTDHIVQPK